LSKQVLSKKGSGVKKKHRGQEQDLEDKADEGCLSQEGREFLDSLPPEIQVLGQLHRYALDIYGEEALPQAWEEYSLWENRPPDPLEEPDLTTIFMTWFVFHWVPKNHRFPSVPVAQHFLETNKKSLTHNMQAFLQKGLQTPYRFFQILDHQPEVSLRLLDLFLERELLLENPSFLVPLEVGEILFSLLLPVEGRDYLLSSAPFRLPRDAEDLLVFYREQMKTRLGPLDESLLLKHASELRSLYAQAKGQHQAQSRLPENSEGHAFVPLRAFYCLQCPLPEALKALLPLSLEDDLNTLLQKVGLPSDPFPHEIHFPLLQRGNPKHKDWKTTAIGWMELGEGSLCFYTNSEERAEALHDRITELLGDRALYTALEDLDPEAYGEELRDRPGESGKQGD